MNVLLLCAGEGRRLQPFTFEKAKPTIPFLSVPLAFYSLALIDHLKFKNLVINTHHLPEQIYKLFNHQIFKNAKNLYFSNEVEALLGSAGAINKAYPILETEENFILMNGDEVILPHQFGIIDQLIQEHNSHKSLATILTSDHPEVGKKFGGIWTDNAGKVLEINKKQPRPDLSGEHFVGVMIINKKIKDYLATNIIEENIFYPILNTAIAQNEIIRSLKIKTEWFETGNPEDFINASEVCATAISNKNSDYWVEHLKQVISYYGGSELFIEKQKPVIADKVNRAIQIIRS